MDLRGRSGRARGLEEPTAGHHHPRNSCQHSGIARPYSVIHSSSMSSEIEIKFRVRNLRGLRRQLRAAGFRLKTRRTHEMNTLYDLPGEVLRKRRELLRLRRYGSGWKQAHKSPGQTGRHSSPVELETSLDDGRMRYAI